LGSAIAVALAKEGALVCLADKDEQALGLTVDRVRDQNGECHTFTFDLGLADEWARGLEAVLERVGGIDILVNMTGGPPPGLAQGHATEVWRCAFESMVLSVIGAHDR